jgi:hypothetical protein
MKKLKKHCLKFLVKAKTNLSKESEINQYLDIFKVGI